jgi:predicted SAM-dependent methyltransferase
LNCDIKAAPGVNLRFDLRDGLPLESRSVDELSGVHVLQDLPREVLGPALKEIHRVLKRTRTISTFPGATRPASARSW